MIPIYTYKFSFLSLSGEINLQVSSPNGPGIELFMDEFRIVFSKQDAKRGDFVINASQIYSQEIEKRLNELMQKYSFMIHPSIKYRHTSDN